MSTSSLPFTREMVVVHKAFRREFGDASAWVRRVAPGDVGQAQLVHAHLDTIFDMLHHHHEAEDLYLWPLLRERASDHAALLDAMQAQHEGIDPALEKARALGAAWVPQAEQGARDAYADALDEMAGPLMAHLDQEEAEILPLAQKLLTEQEWSQLGNHAVGATPKKVLITGFAGILEDASPQEREMMMGVLPLPARLLTGCGAGARTSSRRPRSAAWRRRGCCQSRCWPGSLSRAVTARTTSSGTLSTRRS